MKSLEKLDLSDNRLTFIPPGIFKLPKLNYLNIKNNQLRHISCDFCLYSSFSQIDLSSSLEMIKDENMDKSNLYKRILKYIFLYYFIYYCNYYCC